MKPASSSSTFAVPSRSRVTQFGRCVAFFALNALCSAQTAQVLLYDGGHDDHASSVATDASGSFFVGGDVNPGDASAAFAVLKYNVAGTRQWLARPRGLGAYTAAAAHAVVADSIGNVYAVGYVAQALPFFQTEYGWVVASFDANGAQRWVQLFNGPGNSRDIALRAAVDAREGLYVTGITADAAGHFDWLTIKYSLDGAEQWRRTEGSAFGLDDQPCAINVDAAGNVFVLGNVQTGGVGGPKDLRVVKYSSSGAVLWRFDFSDTATSDEAPTEMAIDANGNCLITGMVGRSISAEDPSVPFVIKLDANGALRFRLLGDGCGGNAVAVDTQGNVIATGTAQHADVNFAAVPGTSKFSPDGTLIWTLPISGTQLAIDALDGSSYVAGENSLFRATKISAVGQVLWQQTIAQGDLVTGAKVDDATGALILVGHSPQNHGDILIVRFTAGSPPASLPPAAPSGLTASGKKGAIALAWTDNSSNESGFLLERSVNGGAFGPLAQLGANVRTYNDTNVTKNRTYAYRVRAFNADGNSAYSNVASTTAR